MPRLAELQQDFAAALLDRTRGVPAGVTSHSSDQPHLRFNVYRNNVLTGLAGVLAGRFPAVRRLVGEEFFAAMARVFIAAHPPGSPVLLEYGAAFPDFLAGFEPVADTPYLPDIARLEWLQNEAYHACDREPLGSDDLADIPGDRLAEVVLELHPSARFVSSPYPVIAIWETNTRDAVVRAIDARSGGDDVMVIRPALAVELRRLKPGAYRFLVELAAGRPLGAAYEAAMAACDHFELQSSLAGLIQSGGIVGYDLDQGLRGS